MSDSGSSLQYIENYCDAVVSLWFKGVIICHISHLSHLCCCLIQGSVLNFFATVLYWQRHRRRYKYTNSCEEVLVLQTAFKLITIRVKCKHGGWLSLDFNDTFTTCAFTGCVFLTSLTGASAAITVRCWDRKLASSKRLANYFSASSGNT